MGAPIRKHKSNRTFVGKAMADVITDIAKANPSVSVIQSAEWEQYQHYPLKAIYPILDKEALSICYQRYQAYETLYNRKVVEANKFVEKYNTKIDLAIAEGPSPKAFKLSSNNFLKKHKKDSVWEYNHMVQRKNNLAQFPFYKLRKAQPLKNEHRLCFEMILRRYQLDLLELQPVFKKMGKRSLVTIPKLDVNSSHLLDLSHKGGGKMTTQVRNSIRRHKKRLEETGVLQDKASRGNTRGVKYFINPCIMAISDDFNQKTMVTDNQLVKMLNTTFCMDINNLTCTIIQTNLNDVDNSTSSIGKKSIKEISKQQNTGDGFLIDKYPTDNFTCTPDGSKEKKQTKGRKNLTDITPKNGVSAAATNKNTDAGPQHGTTPPEKRTDQTTPEEGLPPGYTPKNGVTSAKSLSKAEENTEFLRSQLLEPWDFCVKIGNKEPIKQEISLPQWHLEANTGTLENQEFYELLLQHLFTDFAKIYSKSIDYFPWHKVWKQLYHSWLDSYFFYNRNGSPLDKKTVLNRMQKMIFTIHNKRHGVLRKILLGKFTPPGANIYLNPHSATPGTLLFHYKKVEKHSPKIDKELKDISEKFKEEAQQSKTYNIHKHRLFKKFNQHVNGKIDDTQLFRYAKENLPQELQRDFNLHWTVFINNKKSEKPINN